MDLQFFVLVLVFVILFSRSGIDLQYIIQMIELESLHNAGALHVSTSLGRTLCSLIDIDYDYCVLADGIYMYQLHFTSHIPGFGRILYVRIGTRIEIASRCGII